MHPTPSIIKLSKIISNQKLNKTKEEDSLAKDDQVVNFV